MEMPSTSGSVLTLMVLIRKYSVASIVIVGNTF